MRMTMALLEIRSRLPGFTGYYSEGVGSIAALVKRAGHEFTLFHVTRPLDPEELARRVAATRPDLVGFSCMTHTFSYLKSFAKAIKVALPRVPTLMGGVHAILNPEESIRAEGLDAVCLGEGEAVMPEVLRRVTAGEPLDDIPGLWVKSGDRIRRNENAPMVEDLDSLAPPDRSVFDFERLVSTRENVLYVFCSRGCPYKCPFCSNEAIRNQFPNAKSYLRYKSVERVCEEIDSARQYFPKGLLGIYFQDEILTMKRSWFERFAEVYPKRVGLPFNCNLRADLVSERTADLLKQAGCNSVSLGLESGVESIRHAVVGKPISDAECRVAFDRLHSRGIQINSFNMVGLPGETADDALSTAFFNAESKIDKSMVSIFCPYPGTPLHKQAVADGILSDRMPDTFSDDTPLDQCSISPTQVRFIHDYFGLIIRLTRGRWPGAALKEPLRRLVRRDGWELKVLVGLRRAVKYTLSAPYLWFGRLFFNRQAKVFQGGLVPCDSLVGPRTSPPAATSEPPRPVRRALQMAETCD
ncbi:MAG TPA: radical SAM protein [Gemmataceae bacterium]|nr:radical SAM protein [Gemmataceae bacterium]